tara:strand:- start:13 stop:327 length:315 start_codon:yes stop_codon:yes gene_type:complete
MKHITSKKEIELLSKPYMIDFYADWCGPCKMLGTKLPELEKKYSNVCFVKVDIEKSSELAEIYGIKSIPYIVIVDKDDQELVIKGLNIGRIKNVLEKVNKVSSE